MAGERSKKLILLSAAVAGLGGVGVRSATANPPSAPPEGGLWLGASFPIGASNDGINSSVKNPVSRGWDGLARSNNSFQSANLSGVDIGNRAFEWPQQLELGELAPPSLLLDGSTVAARPPDPSPHQQAVTRSPNAPHSLLPVRYEVDTSITLPPPGITGTDFSAGPVGATLAASPAALPAGLSLLPRTLTLADVPGSADPIARELPPEVSIAPPRFAFDLRRQDAQTYHAYRAAAFTDVFAGAVIDGATPIQMLDTPDRAAKVLLHSKSNSLIAASFRFGPPEGWFPLAQPPLQTSLANIITPSPPTRSLAVETATNLATSNSRFVSVAALDSFRIADSVAPIVVPNALPGAFAFAPQNSQPSAARLSDSTTESDTTASLLHHLLGGGTSASPASTGFYRPTGAVLSSRFTDGIPSEHAGAPDDPDLDDFAPPRAKLAPAPDRQLHPEDGRLPRPSDPFAGIMRPPVIAVSGQAIADISQHLLRRNGMLVPNSAPPSNRPGGPDPDDDIPPPLGTTRWLAQFPDALPDSPDSADFVAITNRARLDSLAMLTPTHDNGSATSRARLDLAEADDLSPDDLPPDLSPVEIDAVAGGPSSASGGGGAAPGSLAQYAFAPPVARSRAARPSADPQFRAAAYSSANSPGIPLPIRSMRRSAAPGAAVALLPVSLTRSAAPSPNAPSPAASAFAGPQTSNPATSTAGASSASPAGLNKLPAGVKTYAVVDLQPSLTGFVTSQSLGVNGIRSGGFIGDSTGVTAHAAIWDVSPSSVTDLHPAVGYANSKILAVNGPQYVGFAAAKLAGTPDHAMLWTAGGGSNAVDLNPTNAKSSYALATSGVQQIGYFYTNVATFGLQTHAALWNSSAASYIDLNPTDDIFSEALGGEGMRQVGFGFKVSAGLATLHALLWTGTANALDLHPTSGAFDDSRAVTLSGSQAAGYGTDDATQFNHAIFWTALNGASAIDLNPASYYDSQVTASNATTQVGVGRLTGEPSNVNHALLWTGSASGFTDLNRYLPANFISAEADGIDATGNIVGWAKDSITGYYHAVEWQPQIPEPTSLVPLAALSALLVRRRRRPAGPTSPL